MALLVTATLSQIALQMATKNIHIHCGNAAVSELTNLTLRVARYLGHKKYRTLENTDKNNHACIVLSPTNSFSRHLWSISC